MTRELGWRYEIVGDVDLRRARNRRAIRKINGSSAELARLRVHGPEPRGMGFGFIGGLLLVAASYAAFAYDDTPQHGPRRKIDHVAYPVQAPYREEDPSARAAALCAKRRRASR